MSYDFGAMQSKISGTLNKYADWKSKTGNNADFKTYLQLFSTTSMTATFQKFEDELEGGGKGDGTKGNTLSFDRFFQTDNNLMFQAKNGDIIQTDITTGKTTQLKESDVAASYGVNGTTTDKGYDIMDFGRDSMQMKQYVFTGLEDGSADVTTSPNGKLATEEFDLAKNPKSLTDIVTGYVNKRGEVSDLRKIFGAEDGKANNVLYTAGGDKMIAVQVNVAYTVNTSGKVKALGLVDFDPNATATTVIKSVVVGDDKKINVTLEDTTNIGNDNPLNTVLTVKTTPGAVVQKTINGIAVSVTTNTVVNTYTEPSTNIADAGYGAAGDPHYNLTGKNGQMINFDHMGTGGHTYRIFEGDNLKMNALYTTISQGITVIGEVSVKAGVDTLSYTMGGVFKLNGNEVTGNTPLILKDGSKVVFSSGKITVIPSDGTGKVDILAQGGSMTVDPAGEFSRLGGIIGTAIETSNAAGLNAGISPEAEAYGNKYDLLTYKDPINFVG